MTMQVGMVGTDGILLASDTRWMETYFSVRQTTTRSKIEINRNRGIAVSFARNMDTSLVIANQIISELKDEDWDDPEISIEQITAAVLTRCEERKDAQCLIVLATPHPCLFSLRIANVGGVVKPLCMSESSKVVMGDNINAAIFFSERCYSRKPIRELVPVAAQLVVGAGKLNPGAIEGLEIILCDASGFHRLSDESIHQLESQASIFDESIVSALSRVQEFTYAPHVVG
jgi:hypothetical protein